MGHKGKQVSRRLCPFTFPPRGLKDTKTTRPECSSLVDTAVDSRRWFCPEFYHRWSCHYGRGVLPILRGGQAQPQRSRGHRGATRASR